MRGVLVKKGYGQGIYIKDGVHFRVTYEETPNDFVITSIYGVDKVKKPTDDILIGFKFKWPRAHSLLIDCGVENIIEEISKNEKINKPTLIDIFLDPYVFDSTKVEMINRTLIPQYNMAIYYNMNKYQWSIVIF